MIAIYVAAYAACYPAVISVDDEYLYILQAQAFAQGEVGLKVADPFTGSEVVLAPSPYPPGTSLLLAPFIKLFGWRGAYLVPLLSLMATVLLTASWLRKEGLSPLFALLVLVYLPGLVLSRVAMSDGISGAVVAASLVLFWRADGRFSAAGLWSGFLAGVSLLFRETNPIVLAPFCLGALLRREPRAWTFITGALVGASLRPLTALWLFGDPFFVKESAGFSLAAVAGNLPLYCLATSVLIPGGLPSLAFYRGPRRPELVLGVLVFVFVYSAYNYNGSESGLLKQIVLSGRFMVPILPLLVFVLAHALPPLMRRIGNRFVRRARPAVPWLGSLSAAAIVVVSIGFMNAWNGSLRRMQAHLYENTPANAVIVSDHELAAKVLNPLRGRRIVVDITMFHARYYRRLLERHGEFYVALIDRSESDFHRRRALANREIPGFIAGLAVSELILDHTVTPSARLRVWRISQPGFRSQTAKARNPSGKTGGQRGLKLVLN